ncbi:MAG: translation elongation factor-like protein [Candidatus Brockarchaeota archaeon]|nr:translation elongation factor-like protein [Candidatus Brockarchaeota archaeon]
MIKLGEEKIYVGDVRHFFSRISVAVIDLIGELKVGDEILIQGKTTNLRQRVDSMEIEHKKVEAAPPGSSIGLKTIDRVREGDKVYVIRVSSQAP